jgi:Icc-related predicted phosphoesterase
MRLLGIADLHGGRDALLRIVADAGPVDATLLGGDITHFGTPDDAEYLVTLAQQSAPTVLAVAGNCDSAEIDARLVDLGVSLAGRGIVLGELGLHGLSAIPPWIQRMYQATEEELAAALEAGYRQVDHARFHGVLAHAPPHGLSADRVFFGRHVGSRALRTLVDEKAPALVLCGHIHEARGVEQVGPTTIVNCGHALRGYYALIDVDERITVRLGRA